MTSYREKYAFLPEHEKEGLRRAGIKLHRTFPNVYYSVHIIAVFQSIGTKRERLLERKRNMQISFLISVSDP